MKGAWLRTAGIIMAIAAVVILIVVVTIHDRATLHTATSGREGARLKTSLGGTYKAVEACTLLTSSDAQAAIGNVDAAPTNGQNAITTNGLYISECSYAHGTENVDDIIRVSLTVRAAINHDGTATNENEFSVLKAVGNQAVAGYGDAAFWDQTQSKLDIKAGNNWYSISNVKGSGTGNGTLAVSKAVADRIKNKL